MSTASSGSSGPTPPENPPLSLPTFSFGDHLIPPDPLLALPALGPLGPTPLNLTCKAPPLILSSALPAVPAKVVDKINNGLFVELKELLIDNMALLQRLQEVGHPSSHQLLSTPTRLRDIQDPLTWVSCFLSFMAVKANHDPTRELVAYALIIIQLARKHGGRGWLSYDSIFRQQLAAGAINKWSELNPSLMAATVLQSATPGHNDSFSRVCSICFGHDHTKADCALAPLESKSRPGTPASLPSIRPRPYRLPDEICRRFNRGLCNSHSCRYEHTCTNCLQKDHGASSCPSKDAKPKSLKLTSLRDTPRPSSPPPK